MSVTDLAGHMGVTVATMSIAIDRLERRAYVRRDRDPRDRRRVLLRITPEGVRLREAKSVLDPVRVEQVLAHLSPPIATLCCGGWTCSPARRAAHEVEPARKTQRTW